MSKTARRMMSPLPYLGKLTLSAGVITDTVRAAGVEGDGGDIGDGVGVWPAATNLEPYGRGITNKEVTGTGIALAATTESPLFSDGHIRITATGNSANAAVRHPAASAVAVSASTVYTVGAWYKKVSGSFSSTGFLFINWLDAGRAYLSTSSAVSVAGVGADWTRYAVTATAHASAAYADVYWVSLGASQTVTIDVTGMSLYASAIDMPYIETDGGTASRVAGTVAAPRQFLNSDGGGMAIRLRHGVSYATTVRPRILQGLSGNNYIACYYNIVDDKWLLSRDNGSGSAESVQSAVQSFAAGDGQTIILEWSSTTISVQVDDASPVTAASTKAPLEANLPATFGFGTTSEFILGRLLWAYGWSGSLSTDARSRLVAYGDNRPLPHQLVGSGVPSFLAHFYGDGTAYRYAS